MREMDRVPEDQQLTPVLSCRWYAPQCPKPSSSSSSSSSKPAKRPLSADAAGYDGYQDEEEGEEEDDNEELADNDNEEEQVILVDEVVNTTIPSSTEYKRALPSHPPASHIHPSRLDHVPAASSNTDPYFNPAEWVPVERNSNSKTESNGKSTMEAPSVNDLKPSESEIVIPEPPSVEMAIPQEQALLDTQSPQEALEKALQAWYTAGYAAALYHVRSGAVKP